MKGVIGAVLAAVLSAIVTVVAQQYWTDQKQSGLLQVDFNLSPEPIIISKPRMVQLAAAAGDSNLPVEITELSLKNTGKRPLENQEVEIKTDSPEKGIIGYGNFEVPGNADDGVSTDFADKGLKITYKLLDVGESHKLWIAYSAYGKPQIQIRRPGLVLRDMNSFVQETSAGDDLLYVLGYIGVGLVAFFLGLAVTFSSIQSSLKKKGLKLEELIASDTTTAPPSSP